MGKLALVLCIAAALSCAQGWEYGAQVVRGVNLGGWLVLEKWITPSVFNGLPSSVNDEYLLCQHLGYAEAEKRLRAHWDSWVTENDIIQLKNAGINHLRIPFGYWAFEIPNGEPWVWGSWDYVMKAVGWAKKYGMQVMIDLHGAPGSQNGGDHSGHAGNIGFYYSDSNLQLATRVIGRVAEIFASDEWKDTVTIIQLLNEPILWDDYNYRLGRLKDYYGMAYKEVRKYNSNAIVAVHDAFIGAENWYYLRDDPSYFWCMLDTHHYQVFTPEWTDWSCDQHQYHPCSMLGKLGEANQKLWTIVGEWSLATPKTCGDQWRFATNEIGVWESVSGWMMWNFKHEAGWNEWDFLASHRLGWIPNLGSGRVPHLC